MSAFVPRRPSLPISAQILALLVGGLVAAQVTTLILTLVLPPAPPQQHSLAEVAGALRGGESHAARGVRPLVRTVETAPPSLQSPGWLVSQRSTRDLAKLLGVGEDDVRLLFYAPPPLAGSQPPPHGPLPPRADAQVAPHLVMASFVFYQAGGPGGGPGGPPPGGMGGPGGMGPPPGGFPSGGFPQSRFPSDSTLPRQPPPADGATRRQERDRASYPSQDTSRAPGAEGGRIGSAQPMPDGSAPGPGGPRDIGGARGPGPSPGQAGPGPVGRTPYPRMLPRSPLDAAVFAPPVESALPASPPARTPAPSPAARPVERAPVPAFTLAPRRQAEPLAPAPSLVASPTPAARPAPAPVERALATPTAPSLFGLARPAYVEGEFVAALRQGPDRWVTVRPRPEGFPNSWQRRVLLWFAISFALVAPLGYLFARRLSAPLRDFAGAAEQLGRDPSAPVPFLDGPAEVGRAARAFNVMQARLRRYVEDRTGMIGAISHDLRTPLARMRFRLERAPPELQQAMGRDIAQMEAMITSVLTFMRDDAAASARERVDLRSLLECVVDEAGAGGGPVELAPGGAAEVEVDVLGVQRVFENLVDNAIKYGERADVRLFLDGGEAVAEIADGGPDLAGTDLEQLFKPFYRGPEARAASNQGMGLGLAVSRATIRAHGGDLRLSRADHGLVAQVRLPLARAA